MRPPVRISTIKTAAPTYSLVDLVTLKALLDVGVTTSDAFFGLMIPIASTTAQRYCNNPFVVETIQDQLWPPRDGIPWEVRPDLNALKLSRWPIAYPAPCAAGTPPPFAAALGAAAGGALPARVYSIRLSYVTAQGETPAGPETAFRLAAGALATIAAPGADAWGLATGYNVYASTSAGAETLQNGSPIGVSSSWTEPSSGLIAGSALPPFILAVEIGGVLNRPAAVAQSVAQTTVASTQPIPVPLCEDVDFIADFADGLLIRLASDGSARDWRPNPVVAIYAAGYAAVPGDVVDAVVDLVKMRWYGQNRDPAIRSENSPGVYEASYVMGTGPGGADDMSAYATAKLDRYRVPVLA